MVPVVGKKSLVSLPVFFSASITYLITPIIKNSVYQYPWFIYVHMDVFSRFIFLHNQGLYIFLDFIFYIKLTTI